jgi:hypothetical protein
MDKIELRLTGLNLWLWECGFEPLSRVFRVYEVEL